MAMLDDIFLDELVDDPEPVLVEEPPATDDRDDDNDNSGQPPLNPSAPSEDAVRVAPKKKATKNPLVILNPQRVTGPRGIQCIEQYFKNVKLKGKGHELSDLNTVMSNLEHWANRMHPRSNFDDVLKRLEYLGHKRPVMTHIKKIRLGMIQDEQQASLDRALSDTEAEVPVQPPTSDEIFDELLATQPSQRHTPLVKEISEAQRQRMLRNRQIAEEKRQARLAAEAERSKRDADNAKTLESIEFQNSLIETQGSQRENILKQGGAPVMKDTDSEIPPLEDIDFDSFEAQANNSKASHAVKDSIDTPSVENAGADSGIPSIEDMDFE